MRPKEKEISEALKFGALATAEKITGVSYKDEGAGVGLDNPACGLGMALHIAANERKEKLLTEAGDSHFTNTLEYYQCVLDRLRFELVMEEPFQHPDYEHGDSLFVYARRDGIVLCFDSYWGKKSVNSGNFMYNWKPDEIDYRHKWTSSGSFNGEIWIGSHDCREAIGRNISMLEEHGKFICPWVKRPWMWLLNYADTKKDGYDHKQITEERISKLPDWVKQIIGEP